MTRLVLVAGSLVVTTTALAQRRGSEEAPPPRIELSGETKGEGQEPPKAGSIILKSSGEWDRVADEAGQVYRARGYQGVVPGVRDAPAIPSKGTEAPAPTAPVLQWLGFQPFSTYSRVFLQVVGNYSYTVTKPDPRVIEVTLPGVRAATPNDERHLVTREFPTAVDRILVEEQDGTTVIRIVLKAPTGYLYRQEGPYLFVDISL